MPALRTLRGWAYQGFRSLPPPLARVGERVLTWRAERDFAINKPIPPAERRLIVGPLNTAGQAQRWARAAETLPDTVARNVVVQRRVATAGGFDYPADWYLSRAVQLRGMKPYQARVLGATHVLAESGWAMLDDVFEQWITNDLFALRRAGVTVGIVVHGSELRDLRDHAEREPHSPFRGEWDERWDRLQRTVERTRTALRESHLPVFVTTPDMLDYVPSATLLPLVIDARRFASATEPLQRERLAVIHAPSNPRLKGTAIIDEVLGNLHKEGLVEYRRLESVPNAQMPARLAAADIVVDQIVMGNVGVLAAEAMAAQRVVVAHVPCDVRSKTPGLPVLEATPDSLERVIRDVCHQRESYRDLAARGPDWVRTHHSEAAAAAVLDRWLSQ